MKICSKCKIEKDEIEFNKKTCSKDGLQSRCKECEKEYKKELYKNNKEKILENNKKYREDNKEKVLDSKKEFYLNNKEKVLDSKKEFYLNNKEKILENNKEYYENNREKIKEYKKAYQENNREKIKEYKKAYQENNREKIRESKKAYRENNKEKLNENKKEYNKAKPKNDLCFKLKETLRRRLNHALRGNYKRSSAVRDLGCSIEEFKKYLEEQFQPLMSWENYGSDWQIDHIIPFKDINVLDDEQLRMVIHYTNLRPIWCWSNMARNFYDDDKIDFSSPTPKYFELN